MTGLELIAKERQRQIDTEGFTEAQDDFYGEYQLMIAATCYHRFDTFPFPPESWPFSAKWWKPKERLSNLVRAGALFQAEKDRLQRIIDNITMSIDDISAEMDQLQAQTPQVESEP